MLRHGRFGLVDKTDQVAPGHPRLHHHIALRVLAVDLDRPLAALDARQLGQRDAVAGRRLQHLIL